MGPIAMKNKYLTMYDYQTGGVWVYIWAESKQDIIQRYPLLNIIEERPEWLTEEKERQFPECDIDAPDEFLQRLYGKTQRD